MNNIVKRRKSIKRGIIGEFKKQKKKKPKSAQFADNSKMKEILMKNMCVWGLTPHQIYERERKMGRYEGNTTKKRQQRKESTKKRAKKKRVKEDPPS
mgnify:CR=1 FL=1